MNLIHLLLTIAVLTVVGLWSWRTYEIETKKKVAWYVKLSAPLCGAGIVLIILTLLALTLFIGVYATCEAIWRSVRGGPFFALAVFIGFLFLTPYHKLFGYSIDHRTGFWKWAIGHLNFLRTLNGSSCYIYKLGPLYIRDPHSHPMKTHWRYSRWHPFMTKAVRQLDNGALDV